MKAKALKRVANHLRKNQTEHEKLFARKLSAWAVRYRPQAIVGPWVADFVLPDYDLIVEIDGSTHFTQAGRLRDMSRDAWFHKRGYRVVHIRNGEVADFEIEDLFDNGRNGPVVEQEGLPAYLTELLESLTF